MTEAGGGERFLGPVTEMTDWCEQEDWVSEGDRVYRCSKCGKRLHPRKMYGTDGELKGWRLPPHKEKGHKIRAAKARQRKIRTGRK
jgi:hypothetical protein